MKKERLLSRLERDWNTFRESFEGLSDSALLKSGVSEQWSMRDVLAHITTWEEEALKAVPLILEDKPLPRYHGIDAFNSREQERKRNLSLDQVKRELAVTHERLMTFLTSIPENVYSEKKRLSKRIRLDTYDHYQKHIAQIATWRTERGLT